jgi:hypothetical protein
MLRKINHRTWRRIILCAKNNGAHTDVIDIWVLMWTSYNYLIKLYYYYYYYYYYLGL